MLVLVFPVLLVTLVVGDQYQQRPRQLLCKFYLHTNRFQQVNLRIHWGAATLFYGWSVNAKFVFTKGFDRFFNAIIYFKDQTMWSLTDQACLATNKIVHALFKYI